MSTNSIHNQQSRAHIRCGRFVGQQYETVTSNTKKNMLLPSTLCLLRCVRDALNWMQINCILLNEQQQHRNQPPKMSSRSVCADNTQWISAPPKDRFWAHWMCAVDSPWSHIPPSMNNRIADLSVQKIYIETETTSRSIGSAPHRKRYSKLRQPTRRDDSICAGIDGRMICRL